MTTLELTGAKERLSKLLVYKAYIDPRQALSRILSEGDLARADFKEAAKWFEAAAESGSAPAQVNLGLMRLLGLGGRPDPSKAFELFLKAAGSGDPAASLNLGVMLYTGEGFPADAKKAASWFEKAADLGDPEAMSVMGALFELGDGVERCAVKAAEYLRRASFARAKGAPSQPC
ncbi:MAG: sel1 repeat family protein [Deltaproteobacteria bacterium]|jgi:TPR repeat protein|nr:sel1 repeat family protein [Deltaproteobacteria bacterium]